MDAMAAQNTSFTIVYLTVDSGADQRTHKRSASLAFVWGIHWWAVNSPHKWPARQKMFPFDDVIMDTSISKTQYNGCWRPADTGGQGIYIQGIDFTIPEHSSFTTERHRKNYIQGFLYKCVRIYVVTYVSNYFRKWNWKHEVTIISASF